MFFFWLWYCHPFHIHVNHFQVISRNGQPESFLR
ncbi:multicopper oxidase domain-containing protein [Xenococcus sp. PCC 7305]